MVFYLQALLAGLAIWIDLKSDDFDSDVCVGFEWTSLYTTERALKYEVFSTTLDFYDTEIDCIYYRYVIE